MKFRNKIYPAFLFPFSIVTPLLYATTFVSHYIRRSLTLSAAGPRGLALTEAQCHVIQQPSVRSSKKVPKGHVLLKRSFFALNPPVVYSIDRSEAVIPVLVLLFVALWFILRGDLLYVLPCVIFFLCFSVLLVLRLPRLGNRELILVFFVRLFDLCLFGFVGFLFLLVSGKGCGLWLWHSLDFSLTFFFFFFYKCMYYCTPT